jgi:nicotinamidase-related amidase
MTTANLNSRLLDRDSTALVMIDLQAKLLPAIFEAGRVVRNSQLLLRLAELLKLPVVLTTQNAAGLGPTVPEIQSLTQAIEPIDKTSFGCFGDEAFKRALKASAPQANTLLVAGIESHICVTQTVLGALEDGYLVHVAEDAVSSRTPENWRVGLQRMERSGAVMSSTEMMVYELLGRSNTAEFKAILPFLKEK